MRRYYTLGFGAAASLFDRRLVKLDLMPSDLICVQLIAHVHMCFHTDTYHISPASVTGLSWLAVSRNPIAAIDGTDAVEMALILVILFLNALKGREISAGVQETRLRLQSPP